MSNTRGHDCVYALGHEGACRTLLQSKAVHNQFIVNFLQRRMNTSYSKKMYYNYRDGAWVHLRERWELRTVDFIQFIESTLELVTKVNGVEKVIGRAFPSGVVWLHTYCLCNMHRRARRKIEAHLRIMYDQQTQEGQPGYWYTRKGTQHVIRTTTPGQPGESFTDIMRREWHV